MLRLDVTFKFVFLEKGNIAFAGPEAAPFGIEWCWIHCLFVRNSDSLVRRDPSLRLFCEQGRVGSPQRGLWP